MSISVSVAQAAEIKRLRAENERLRSALKVILTWAFMDTQFETRGSLVSSHVLDLCTKTLGGTP